MPLLCPVCRASNDIGPSCRRCRADLSLCVAVEVQHEHALAAAQSAAAQGRLGEAFRMIERAAALRTDRAVTRVYAVLKLLAGDRAGAWSLYRSLGTTVP